MPHAWLKIFQPFIKGTRTKSRCLLSRKNGGPMWTAASEFYGLIGIVVIIPSLYLDTSDHSVIKMTAYVAEHKISVFLIREPYRLLPIAVV